MERKSFKSIDLAYIGLSAAVIAVCSWVSVQIGAIPVTLQTMAICLTAGLFGLKRGTLATVIYILLGTVGIPIFSGFKGGIGVIIGATGGYIIGFIFTAAIVGFVSDKSDKLWALILSMVIGIAVCYAFGTVWFIAVYSKDSAITLSKTLSLCVIPFIPFDTVKIIIASLLTLKLKKHIKK